MFYPLQLGSSDLSDYIYWKAYSYCTSGWLQPLNFHKISRGKYCLFKGECRQSQIINEINHKLWIIIKKSGKIRSCHSTCMAGMGQYCNHVAAAMYRIKAAVRNGLTNPSCTSIPDQWLSNHKDLRPMKVKDMKFRREYFCQRGKRKLLLVSTPKEKYNPLSEQGNMKMLTLIDSESLRDVCSENIQFSAFPKPDVDFISDFVTQQVDEVPENLCRVYDWISKSGNVESSFANFFVDMTKE